MNGNGFDLVADDNGDILVVGFGRDGPDDQEDLLPPLNHPGICWRVTSDGILDESFNESGFLYLPAGCETEKVGHLSGIQAIGTSTYILSGNVACINEEWLYLLLLSDNVSIVKPLLEGSDSVFPSGFSVIETALDRNGRIIVLGSVTDNENRFNVLLCFLPTGELDRFFGNDGMLEILPDHGIPAPVYQSPE